MADSDRPAGRTGTGLKGAGLVTRPFPAAPPGGSPRDARSGRPVLALPGPEDVSQRLTRC